MLSTRKNTSVVSMLRDRELSLKKSAYFSTAKIMRRLLNSDKELYTRKWTKTSQEEISYENGSLFFRGYAECYSLNAINKQTNDSPPFLPMEKNDVKSICHAISYSGKSVPQNIENICRCECERCICLSPCLLSISEDNWLFQHLMINGKLVKEVYLNNFENNLLFRFCRWDTNGERFSLISEPDDDEISPNNFGEKDVVIHLLVFTFPLEFYIRLEVKRSVFGKDVINVSLHHQLLMVRSTHYAFYNFDEFIKQGTLIAYRLGDTYKDEGKIGSYPTGLPSNFIYDELPPILFIIDGFGKVYEFCFGGYPCQYITLHPTMYYKLYDVHITAVGASSPIKLDKPWLIKYRKYNNEIRYHPDHSNRIILRTYDSVDIYKIIAEEDNYRISREFSFQPFDELTITSLRNRKIVVRSHITVHRFYYEPQLNVLGILAERPSDSTAFVKLYDNMTGEYLRTIEIHEKNISHGDYWFYIHPCAIIILERRGGWIYERLHAVHVYMM